MSRYVDHVREGSAPSRRVSFIAGYCKVNAAIGAGGLCIAAAGLTRGGTSAIVSAVIGAIGLASIASIWRGLE